MSNRRLFAAFVAFDVLIVLGVLLWVFHPFAGKPTAPPPPGPGKPEVVADPSLAVAPPKVKLAVLVVFDQMRGDYVDAWRPLFGEAGFKRLQNEGAWYGRCTYPYSATSTGPGHASILSGTSAWRHGIIENEWFDRATGTRVYCAGSDRYATVPPKPEWLAGKTKENKVVKEPYSGTPDRFVGDTLADVLKSATAGKGKVFGLSLKDRSAIFPTGKHPDGAYWFDGRFVTSTYYRDGVHPWVAAFNAEKLADSWFGRSWDRFRPDWNYEPYSGPDDAPGEAKKAGLGVTFPHPMTGGKPKLEKEYYEALAFSPFGNDLLLALAKRCVVEEKLGQRDAPDLLTVSFSSNDLIGHTFGPDSQEVLDVTLRSDAVVQDFLQFLDDKVGKGNYALVLTADHGICPVPEYRKSKGAPAGRIPIGDLLVAGEEALQAKYGKLDGHFKPGANSKKDTWIETQSIPWFYLNDRLIRSRGLNESEVAAALAAALLAVPNMQATYTRGQLTGDPAGLDDVGKLVKRSFYPDRSGDVYAVAKPYYLLSNKNYGEGTSHGTPHDYDRWVPLLVFGPGIPGGKRDEDVHPQQAAAILAHFLGIKPPQNAEYGLPKSLFED